MLQLIITTLILLLIALTMFLRAHEMQGKRTVDNVRRIGLAGSCLTAITLAVGQWLGWDVGWLWTSFLVATFLVYFSDGQIPWHKWVWNGLQEELEQLPAPTLRSDRQLAMDRYRDEHP